MGAMRQIRDLMRRSIERPVIGRLVYRNGASCARAPRPPLDSRGCLRGLYAVRLVITSWEKSNHDRKRNGTPILKGGGSALVQLYTLPGA